MFAHSSIWPIDGTLSGATTLGQSGHGSNGDNGALCIPQSSRITGASPLLGETYPFEEMLSVYFAAPMVSSQVNDWTFLFDPYMWPKQFLSLWARVDMGVMAMKGHSAFPNAPALLELHNGFKSSKWLNISIWPIHGTWTVTTTLVQSGHEINRNKKGTQHFSKFQNWTFTIRLCSFISRSPVAGEGLSPLLKRSRYILQPKLTGLLSFDGF